MKSLLIITVTHFSIACLAQDKQYIQLVNVTGAWAPKLASTSADYFRVWSLGKPKRLELGAGARFTSLFASQQNFTSAPADLARDPNKVDTLFIRSGQANSLNLAIHLGYKLGDKIWLGFNIDIIGFSFGGKQTGEFLANNTAQNISSTPTPFNILLINNNDRGTLNSEFFLRYCIDNRWSVKAAYQHLFAEYTTDNKIQTLPTANDRFRIKANMFSFGLAITLH